MRNREIAEIFDRIADMLEVLDDNPFKIRAYRRASQSLNGLSEDIDALARKGRLTEVPGVGKELAAKIIEIINTGKLRYYEIIKSSVPKVILGMMDIPGIGPKTAKLLYYKLKIRSIDQLEKRAREHKLQGRVAGLKEKTEVNITRGIELIKKRHERMTLREAIETSDKVVGILSLTPGIKQICPAGSLRRMKETVRDIDILVTAKKPNKIMQAFTGMPNVEDVIARGDTKSSVVTNTGVQVDLRVVDENSFGAAMVYFTGSQAHNIHIRHIAKKNGLKVNEYGVFAEKNNKMVAGKNEADVYKSLGLSWIPPELREDRGEIEASAKGALPRLIKLSDVRGDVHVHSNWSDGSNSTYEIAVACKKLGYEYVVIADHSKTLRVARGLSLRDVQRKLEEIRSVNDKIKGIKVLAGTEVDILQDGSLDYDAGTLGKFDVVVAAIHSGFKEPKAKLTERVVRAIKTGSVDIIAHPTGRLMGLRDPYELDMDKIFSAAKAARTCLEINAFPGRLDLDDVMARAAKEAGVKLSIGTDAHETDQLDSMRLGLSVARRGWLQKKDVLNTMDLSDLLKFLKK